MAFTPSAPAEQGILEFLKGIQTGATKGAVAGQEFGQKITEIQFRKQMGIGEDVPRMGDAKDTLGKRRLLLQEATQSRLRAKDEFSKLKFSKAASISQARVALTLSVATLKQADLEDDPAQMAVLEQEAKDTFQSAQELLKKSGIVDIGTYIGQEVFEDQSYFERLFKITPTVTGYKAVPTKGKMIKPADVTDADWKIANDETKRELIRMFR